MENREWNTFKLGEVTTKIGSGSTPTGGSNAYKNDGISLVRSQNVLDFTFSKDGLAFIDDDQAFKLRGVTVQENDILFNITGDSVARVCKVPAHILPARVNQHVAILRADNNNLSYDFLLYLMQSKKEELLIMSEIGATRNAITKVMLENLEINLPPLREQTAIASVLSSLDDKIDLLHQQNQILQALAETLFRQWFIEEAKEDWEELPFSEWISETIGGDWGKETLQGEFAKEVYCIRGTDIADLLTRIPTKTPIRFVKEKKFQSIEPKEGDIIIEISGGTENQSTGRAYFINNDIKSLFGKDLVFSNFCRLIRIKDSNYSFFVYSYLKYLYNQDEFFNLENGSSGIKNLDYKSLLFENKYRMPKEDLVLKYNNLVSDNYKKINHNKQQIKTLTQMRDTLLPKLMSGEVRVKL